MTVKQIGMIVSFVIISSYFTTVFAGDRMSLTIGGGYGGFDTEIKSNSYHVPQPELPPPDDVDYAGKNGYNLWADVLFPVDDNLGLGIGVHYLFSGSGNFDDIFSERYDLTGTDDNNYKADINFLMPYLVAQYKWSFMGIGLYSKLHLGYGFGKLKTKNPLFREVTRESNGFGIIPSVGTPFRINRIMDLNLEAGYRYIRTGAVLGDYYSYTRNRLDFSGPFVQGGISFNL